MMPNQDLSFLSETFEAENPSCVRGGCAAVYMTKIKLEDDDFNKIMAQITQAPYLENMGQITSPFMYLLAASYLYSEKSREKIISFSAQFNTQLINDLISDVRKGKDGKRINLF